MLILDYKTNRPPPETPDEVAPAYVAQLAAYRAALKALFPGRALRAALVVDRWPEAHGNPIKLRLMTPNSVIFGAAVEP